MRPALILSVAIVPIAMLTTGCGGMRSRPGTASLATQATASTQIQASASLPSSHATSSFRGDEDDDDQESHTMGKSLYGDDDNDSDNDHTDNGSKGYYDRDDGAILEFGRPADAAQARTIAALVERYHAAVVAQDGVAACSMMDRGLARALPEDYGRAPGPAFLRGARTCHAVASRLFRYVHRRMSGSIEVLGVRVGGPLAHAQIGSRTIPAGLVLLRRERGVWRIDDLLYGPFP